MKLTPTAILALLLTVSVAATGYLLIELKAARTAAAAANELAAKAAADNAAPISKTTSGAIMDGGLWKQLIGEENATPTGSAAATANIDYVAFRERLRAAGFPTQTINNIIRGMINNGFAARRAALQPNVEFWSKWNSWGSSNPQIRGKLQELWKEERDEVRRALGDEYAESPDFKYTTEHRFGDLPPNKAITVSGIYDDYMELVIDVSQKSNGIMLPADYEKLALLEKEKRADLATVLTPQELQEYELRSSDTAENLRYQLSAFAPTEQEFRSIFAIKREFDLKNPSQDGEANTTDADASDNENLQNKIKSALGEARYAEYELSLDSNFRQLNSLAERLELPKENAIAVHELSKDVEARIKKIQFATDLTLETRAQALAAIDEEANAKVIKALGPNGAEAYKKSGGWWLVGIQNR